MCHRITKVGIVHRHRTINPQIDSRTSDRLQIPLQRLLEFKASMVAGQSDRLDVHHQIVKLSENLPDEAGSCTISRAEKPIWPYASLAIHESSGYEGRSVSERIIGSKAAPKNAA